MRDMDQAVALLEEYQGRLDRAYQEGPAAYDALFADPPEGVGVHEIGLDRVLRRINGTEAALLGYKAEDLVGRLVHDFIVMSEASRRAIEKKLAGEIALKPFARTFQRSDGTAVTMALVDRLLKDASGSVVGIRTAMTPITG
jgi:PAS domain S-box-containing protein